MKALYVIGAIACLAPTVFSMLVVEARHGMNKEFSDTNVLECLRNSPRVLVMAVLILLLGIAWVLPVTNVWGEMIVLGVNVVALLVYLAWFYAGWQDSMADMLCGYALPVGPIVLAGDLLSRTLVVVGSTYLCSIAISSSVAFGITMVGMSVGDFLDASSKRVVAFKIGNYLPMALIAAMMIACSADQARGKIENSGFYNAALVADDDPTNDFDFADPFANNADLSPEKLRAGDPEAIEALRADFFETLSRDRAIAAADIAYADAVLGTKFCDDFRDPELAPAAQMNAVKDAWIELSNADYQQIIASFEQFLSQATLEVYRDSLPVSDQAYMHSRRGSGGRSGDSGGRSDGSDSRSNGSGGRSGSAGGLGGSSSGPGVSSSADEAPDIFVFSFGEPIVSDDLWLTFRVSFNNAPPAVLRYRVTCGYQPCNVIAAMSGAPGEITK